MNILGRSHRSTVDGRKHGQSLAELAIITPVVLLVFVGITDLGRAFYSVMTLNQAVQQGALVAVVWQHVTDCSDSSVTCTLAPCIGLSGYLCANNQVRAAIKEAAPSGMISDSQITLGTSTNPTGPWAESDWVAGAQFQITVVYTFNFMTPGISRLTSLPLKATLQGCRNGPLPSTPTCP